MCRDMRETCLRYESARVSEKAVTEATALRLDRVEEEFAEAVREHETDTAEIRGERNRASLRTERALANLKEGIAEVGGAVICENWCYSLTNGQIHRQRWQMAAAAALEQYEDDDEPFDDDDVILDATSLGQALVRHEQRTDMTGSFAGKNGTAEPLANDMTDDVMEHYLS